MYYEKIGSIIIVYGVIDCKSSLHPFFLFKEDQ